MKSYDKLLNRYGQFAKIYEALKLLRPRRLYKLTESGLGEWFLGIPHSCTQTAVHFHLVAEDHELPVHIDGGMHYVTGHAVLLYKLPTYKIEQLKLTDLPAYVSAPYKTVLYDKLLMRKVKILED